MTDLPTTTTTPSVPSKHQLPTQTMNPLAFHHTLTPPDTTYHVVHRDALIADVHTNLTLFETELTELERLWLIHDKNRTPMFEIGVSLWRPRRQSLQDKLAAYWSADKSSGRAWMTCSEGKEILHPDCVVGTANLMLRAQYDALVARCEVLGFLDYLQVALCGLGDFGSSGMRCDNSFNRLSDMRVGFTIPPGSAIIRFRDAEEMTSIMKD